MREQQAAFREALSRDPAAQQIVRYLYTFFNSLPQMVGPCYTYRFNSTVYLDRSKKL